MDDESLPGLKRVYFRAGGMEPILILICEHGPLDGRWIAYVSDAVPEAVAIGYQSSGLPEDTSTLLTWMKEDISLCRASGAGGAPKSK